MNEQYEELASKDVQIHRSQGLDVHGPHPISLRKASRSENTLR